MNARAALHRSITGVVGAVALAGMLGAAPVLGQGQKVLKFIPQADLRILDPIATTAYITRNHGYMVYDTLFAMDDKFQVQPQMVEKCDAERRTASPTRSRCATASSSTTASRCSPADCIASIERWAQARRARPEARRGRPSRGRRSTTRPSRSSSSSPFPLALEALAKPSSNVPFIMPERIAKTDAVQRTSPTRSARGRSSSSRTNGCRATRSST